MKLNLGCGNDIRSDYINVDKYMQDKNILNISLETMPLPFDSGSVTEILLYDVLEHLWVNPYDFMVEMYRILEKGGIIKITLPFFLPSLNHVRWMHTKRYFEKICTNGPVGQHHVMFHKVKCCYRWGYISRDFPFIRL